MLITFKSKASGDVIMFGDVGTRLLNIMGKGADKQGIITVEQLPQAIARLKQVAAETPPPPPTRETTDAKGEKVEPAISLALRAVPLIELLEYSLKANVPVTWGA